MCIEGFATLVVGVVAPHPFSHSLLQKRPSQESIWLECLQVVIGDTDFSFGSQGYFVPAHLFWGDLDTS